jgi:predicted alpha/beta-hydrolase family hydrolase
MERFVRALSAFLCALALVVPAVGLAEVLTLEPRDGVTMDVHIHDAGNPVAVLIMMEGGPGRFENDGRSFTRESWGMFARHGIVVAAIDAPSDQRNWQGGMSPRYRASRSHAEDIDAAFKAMSKRYRLPVLVAGISLGSRSAAAYAVRRSHRIAGVVLMSSSTRPPRGRSVAAMGLERVAVPVLAVAHKDDGCRGTPPEDADEIVAAATSSPSAKTLMISGGAEEAQDPCVPRTPHTFYGVEKDTVAGIAAFIGANNRR